MIPATSPIVTSSVGIAGMTLEKKTVRLHHAVDALVVWSGVPAERQVGRRRRVERGRSISRHPSATPMPRGRQWRTWFRSSTVVLAEEPPLKLQLERLFADKALQSPQSALRRPEGGQR